MKAKFQMDSHNTYIKTQTRQRKIKQLPLESAGFDMDRFLKAPYLTKTFKSDGILDINALYVKNLDEATYNQLVPDFGSLCQTTESHGFQIGFTIRYKGTKEDQHIIYVFDPSWVSNEEDESTFNQWFRNEYESNNIGIITSDVRGWGAKKINNLLDLISYKYEGFEIKENIEYTVCENSSITVKKTTSKSLQNKTSKTDSMPESVSKVLESVLEQQKNLTEQLEKQQKIISLLMENLKLTSLS